MFCAVGVLTLGKNADMANRKINSTIFLTKPFFSDFVFSFTNALLLNLGLIIAALSGLRAAYSIFVALLPKIVRYKPVYPLIVSLYFFAGIQLFFLGVIGEYVSSIIQTRNRPRVIERARINFNDDEQKKNKT